MRKRRISDEEARILYQQYLTTMSNDDALLRDEVFEFEKLFDDFCFLPNSIIGDYIKYAVDYDGEIVEEATDYFLDLKYQRWRMFVKVLRDKNTQGVTYPNERKIVINRKYKNDESTILHEMIHAHQTIIDGTFSYYHDILLLSLYQKLSEKITDLDDRIRKHSHEHFAFEVAMLGGVHDILFFLKSLDLDFRMGYDLGTVCGYGRDSNI